MTSLIDYALCLLFLFAIYSIRVPVSTNSSISIVLLVLTVFETCNNSIYLCNYNKTQDNSFYASNLFRFTPSHESKAEFHV